MNQKETVLEFIRDLNEQKYPEARGLVTEGFSFQSPVIKIGDPTEYFRQMGELKIKYDVKKAFSDGDDVCVFYDYTIKGMTRFGCGWYKLKDGKIASLRIVSDAPN